MFSCMWRISVYFKVYTYSPYIGECTREKVYTYSPYTGELVRPFIKKNSLIFTLFSLILQIVGKTVIFNIIPYIGRKP